MGITSLRIGYINLKRNKNNTNVSFYCRSKFIYYCSQCPVTPFPALTKNSELTFVYGSVCK